MDLKSVFQFNSLYVNLHIYFIYKVRKSLQFYQLLQFKGLIINIVIVVFSGDDCGGTWTSPSGILTSPNYPNLYRHIDSCVYFIKVPGAQQITFDIVDFETELFKDVLEYGIGNRIPDWNNDIHLRLGYFEGLLTTENLLPDPITVHNDTMWFYWSTDRTGGIFRGWKLVYTTGG